MRSRALKYVAITLFAALLAVLSGCKSYQNNQGQQITEVDYPNLARSVLLVKNTYDSLRTEHVNRIKAIYLALDSATTDAERQALTAELNAEQTAYVNLISGLMDSSQKINLTMQFSAPEALPGVQSSALQLRNAASAGNAYWNNLSDSQYVATTRPDGN